MASARMLATVLDHGAVQEPPDDLAVRAHVALPHPDAGRLTTGQSADLLHVHVEIGGMGDGLEPIPRSSSSDRPTMRQNARFTSTNRPALDESMETSTIPIGALANA
jgi:hypothetical protein